MNNPDNWTLVEKIRSEFNELENSSHFDGLYIFANFKTIGDFFSDIDDLGIEVDPSNHTFSIILGKKTKKQFKKILSSNKYTHYRKVNLDLLNI